MTAAWPGAGAPWAAWWPGAWPAMPGPGAACAPVPDGAAARAPEALAPARWPGGVAVWPARASPAACAGCDDCDGTRLPCPSSDWTVVDTSDAAWPTAPVAAGRICPTGPWLRAAAGPRAGAWGALGAVDAAGLVPACGPGPVGTEGPRAKPAWALPGKPPADGAPGRETWEGTTEAATCSPGACGCAAAPGPAPGPGWKPGPPDRAPGCGPPRATSRNSSERICPRSSMIVLAAPRPPGRDGRLGSRMEGNEGGTRALRHGWEGASPHQALPSKLLPGRARESWGKP